MGFHGEGKAGRGTVGKQRLTGIFRQLLDDEVAPITDQPGNRRAVRLGVDEREAVVVGDSRYDLEAARNAGVHCIGLRLDADSRIERVSDLLALVDPSGV